jgi:hypothetical protein
VYTSYIFHTYFLVIIYLLCCSSNCKNCVDWFLFAWIFSCLMHFGQVWILLKQVSICCIELPWGEILRARPDGPWGPPSFLYSGYWPGRGSDPSSPSSADVTGTVELYLYPTPPPTSGPSRPVLKWTLPLLVPNHKVQRQRNENLESKILHAPCKVATSPASQSGG